MTTGSHTLWPQLPGQEGGATPQTRTEAEYIWSAASGQPFDTCHVQIDWWDREAWFVQDHATGTVRAYTDPSGEIAEQYGFDAFGNMTRRDQFTLVKSGSQGYYRTFRQRLGHQGLFADRLDGHTNTRQLDVGVDVWYQSRSRWYMPELGRFATSDPHGTGSPVQAALAMLGMTPSSGLSGSFDWEANFGDGWDTFTAYGANPVTARDPSGLFLEALTAMVGGFSLNQRDLVAAGYIVAGAAAVLVGVEAYQFYLEELIWEIDADGGALHIRQADAVAKAESLVDQIELHMGKLADPGGPKDPRDHWWHEVKNWVNQQVDAKIKHMKGKTRDKWIEQVHEWRKRLDRLKPKD